MKVRLTKKQRNRLIQRIKYYIGKNYNDLEICDTLQIRPNTLKDYKKKILQRDRQAFELLDKYAVYSDYVMKSQQIVRECDHLRVKFSNKGQWTALVAAIKLKSDQYDKCIKIGQELGLIERKVGEIKYEGKLSIAAMTNEEIEKRIEEEAIRMIAMTKQNVIPMRPELLGIAGADIAEILPPNVTKITKANAKRFKCVELSTKVTLKK